MGAIDLTTRAGAALGSFVKTALMRRRDAELFERAPVAFVTLRADGTIARSNAKARALLGTSPEDPAQSTLASMAATDEDADRLESFTRELFEERTRATCELGLRARSGKVLHARLEPISGGRFEACLAVHDLTDGEHGRATQSHAQKMEAVGTLASGIAHEFNNLLMALQGSVHMVECSLVEDHPSRIHLEQMRASIDGGAALTRRLLAFSRKQPAPSIVFDLEAAVARDVEMLKRLIGDDIEIVLRLDARDARIDAPPAEIDQALMNLVVNARDAMPSGGRITIHTENRGSYVVLSVEDTGPGIPEHVRARIFEPFFTTKEPGSGTGLGLAMVHGIVKRAGGLIRVISARNQGARFEIFLPKSDAPVAVPSTGPTSKETRARGSGGSETVLLVEDDHLVRVTTRFYLEEAGYRVLEAATGAEALECCARFPRAIDLLLTDLSMPGADGREVAQRVRELRSDIALVVMSAHDVVARAGRVPWDSAVPLLQKPFTAEALLTTVRSALDASAAARGEEGRRARPRSLLFVEDDDSARVVLTTYLERFGWDVVATATASQAMKVLRERATPFSVLLTDYSLPDGCGADLARDLRAHAPDARVVYLTGNAEPERAAPGDRIVVKPVDLPRLVRELESIVAGPS
jgi:signal transduction histidine kinase/DNA-binding response OmpR family regulator